MDPIQELDYAANLLYEADTEGLLAEVVVFALDHMKKNPSLTISEALDLGYNEWIK